VAVHHRAAGATDVIAMLLQARRHLEFVVEHVLAKPMRVTAAGSFFGRRMGRTTLRPGGAGTRKDENEAKCANHDAFPS
jgi:hypothetical protein